MNKKANVTQIIIVLTLITSFIMTGIFGLVILNKFSNAFSENNSGESVTNIENGLSSYAIFDNIIFIVTILFFLLFIFSAFYIETNPVFFFVNLFILIFLVIVSSVFSNILGVIGEQTVIANETSVFSNSIALAENFPIITTFVGLLFMLVLYGVWRSR